MEALELFEREAELRAVDAVIDRAVGGLGGVLALEGAAGAGKTALLRAALAHAGGRGALVLTARAGEFEQDFPYGVARQLFERLLADAAPEELPRLLAGPAGSAATALGLAGAAPGPTGPAGAGSAPGPTGSAGAAPDVFAVLHGLYWLVANLAEMTPLVLAIDDAHWADGPSLQLLAYLARRVEELPVLLAVSVRTGESGTEGPVMTSLLADPATTRVVPAPLTTDGATALLRSALGAEPDPLFVDACTAATAGNPFLLRQLADAVAANDLEPTAAGAAQVADLGPRTVGRAALLRVGRLPAPARALAHAIAVLGPEARLRDAAQIAGLDLAVAGIAADELRRIDLVTGDGALDFVHPIVRAAVYRDLTAHERSGGHARAVEILRAYGAAPADVAPHLLSVEPAGSTEVAELLAVAGRQALDRGDPAGAVQLLRRALAEPPPPHAAAGLLADLGHAELQSGAIAEADAHLTEAVARTDEPHARVRRTLLLARARGATDSPGAAAVLLEQALADAGDDAELALKVATEVAGNARFDEHTGKAMRAQIAAYERLAGDTPAERLMLATIGRQAYFTGRPAGEALAFVRRALGGDRLAREAGPESVVLHRAILVAMLADDVTTAKTAIDAATLQARERGSVLGYAYALISSGMLNAFIGDMAAAEADARSALTMVEHGEYVRRMILWTLVQAQLARGGVDEAGAELERAGLMRPISESGLSTSRLLHARAMVHLDAGRPAEAVADLQQIAAREAHWQVADREVPWREVLALAYLELGDADAAHRIATEQLAEAGSWTTSTNLGRAHRVLGVATPGAEGLRHLEDAVTLLEHSPARLELAKAHLALGTALRHADRKAEAREPLRQAVALAGACRASTLQAQAHDELVAAGARPRRVQVSGADALTAGERRVADMAAAGHSNREIAQALFVTAKTVENHLGRAYGKLGIRSRDELAAALGEPQLVR